MYEERGIGTTTDQMKAAPEGAHFFWCNSDLSYPRYLAARLGRHDLRIRSLYDLRFDRLAGLLRSQVVVDHAARLTPEQEDMLRYLHD